MIAYTTVLSRGSRVGSGKTFVPDRILRTAYCTTFSIKIAPYRVAIAIETDSNRRTCSFVEFYAGIEGFPPPELKVPITILSPG